MAVGTVAGARLLCSFPCLAIVALDARDRAFIWGECRLAHPLIQTRFPAMPPTVGLVLCCVLRGSIEALCSWLYLELAALETSRISVLIVKRIAQGRSQSVDDVVNRMERSANKKKRRDGRRKTRDQGAEEE